MADNSEFIACWNEILTPKWIRFRHLLSGNGKIHSDVVIPHLGVAPGAKVLDFGCGFGENSLEFGRIVGPTGEVLGIDCTKSFIDIANQERDEAGLANVRYELGDAEAHALPDAYYDVAFARFGVMFFESAVRALRNVHRSLKPGGTLCLIVWRAIADNPCWGLSKTLVREILPAPGPAAQSCGPGPFSWADAQTDREMLAAARFDDVALERIDADIRVGTTLDEAIDYQLLVGPSGEIVREAGEEGKRRLPEIRAKLTAALQPHTRNDGVYLASSTWMITAKKR
jgi:SAM-dependent methyltransferase